MNAIKQLYQALQSKDQTKISEQSKLLVSDSREWLQEHGEWALLVGLITGVIFVLFFKIIVLLMVLGGLASYVIWSISAPKPSLSSYDHDQAIDADIDSAEIDSKEDI